MQLNTVLIYSTIDLLQTTAEMLLAFFLVKINVPFPFASLFVPVL